jgi:uncharacterized membrane protein
MNSLGIITLRRWPPYVTLMQVTYTLLVGTYIRKGHKHGRSKKKIEQEQRKSFVRKQMYFSANNDIGIALKYKM